MLISSLAYIAILDNNKKSQLAITDLSQIYTIKLLISIVILISILSCIFKLILNLQLNRNK